MVDAIIVLRHGIRLDVDDRHYWRHYLKRTEDVPLSSRGIIQAREAAEFLARENIRSIFSSPFFRTLQTAHIVAERLQRKIHVEFGFMEMLNPLWFRAYPSIIPREEAIALFPTIEPSYESYANPDFPETVDMVDSRVRKTLEHLTARLEGTLLVVGHGASTEATAKALMQTHSLSGFEQRMCALNKFVRKDGCWELEYATTEHLSFESVIN